MKTKKMFFILVVLIIGMLGACSAKQNTETPPPLPTSMPNSECWGTPLETWQGNFSLQRTEGIEEEPVSYTEMELLLKEGDITTCLSRDDGRIEVLGNFKFESDTKASLTLPETYVFKKDGMDFTKIIIEIVDRKIKYLEFRR